MSPSHQWYGVIPGWLLFYALIVVALVLFGLRVDDAEVAVEVEAVGACGDDLLEAVALQGLDVPLGEGLEEVLVADAAGRLARALLLGAQDGEVHAARLKDLDHRAGDFPVPLVEDGVKGKEVADRIKTRDIAELVVETVT